MSSKHIENWKFAVNFAIFMKQNNHSRLRKLATISLAVATLSTAPALHAQMPAPSIEALRRNFQNPPNDTRPMVRWWWFGTAVVKPEILRELQQMKADGIQGAELAFEYPEVLDDPSKNLKNLPFLSPGMLDDVAYAQSEGRKLGLRIDLTLGSGWPYGGPSITLEEASTRIRLAEVPVPARVTSVSEPSLQEGESLISADIANLAASTSPAADFDAATAKALKITGNTASVDASEKPRIALFFILSHTRQQVKRAAVGAEGYVLDSFSHEAVAKYLKTVGEPLIAPFGNTPPYAIFSDSLEAYGSDWTPNLPAEFLKRRGYDLIPHLPELVAGGSLAADNVRHDYGKTLTELVNENYLKQMTAWAVAHNTKFRSQTYGEPAVSFSSQNLASLAEGEGPQWRAFSTLRWASSANHVFNHDVTSGETFTWLHSPVFRAIPLDMKQEADIDFIMGENQIIYHGWPYSPPAGEVPEPGWSLYAAASFNDHNPWHPVMPAVTGYIGRMSYLMRQGEPANQVAILLPTDDAWAGFTSAHDTVTGVMNHWVTPALMSIILSAGYNVDYIDAEAIDKVGIKNQILLLPPTERIQPETLTKIAAYATAGGKVIAVDHLPTLTPDGKQLTADTSEIALVPDVTILGKALSAAATPDLQMTATDDATKKVVGFIRRKLPTTDIYLVVNTSNKPVDFNATFATGHKHAEEWDGDTGAATTASAKGQSIHLDAYGSRVFVFTDSASAVQPIKSGQTTAAVDLSTGWKLTFPGIDKTVDEPTLTDWTADPTTRNYSGEGIYVRDFNLATAASSPVYLEVDGGKPMANSTPVAGHVFAFYDPPIQAAALVTINGQAAGALWHPPYRLDVTKLLKPGTNHIEIHVFNTAINAWASQPPHDYAPLVAKYGDRFQMQDLNLIAPVPSGILGTIKLLGSASESNK
jgi:hypothetical protein